MHFEDVLRLFSKNKQNLPYAFYYLCGLRVVSGKAKPKESYFVCLEACTSWG